MEVLKRLKDIEIQHLEKTEAKDTTTSREGTIAFSDFLNYTEVHADDKIITYHAIDYVAAKTDVQKDEVTDDTCESDEPTPREPRIEGADNVTINQGIGINLTEGVKAYDADGNEIQFTVNPSAIDKCDVGEHTITYSAEGVEKTRIVIINQIKNPTISGLTELIVEVGEEFDPLEGVTAVDGNGNTVQVEVVESADNLIYEGTNIDFNDGEAVQIVERTFAIDNKSLAAGDTVKIVGTATYIDGLTTNIDSETQIYEVTGKNELSVGYFGDNDGRYFNALFSPSTGVVASIKISSHDEATAENASCTLTVRIEKVA